MTALFLFSVSLSNMKFNSFSLCAIVSFINRSILSPIGSSCLSRKSMSFGRGADICLEKSDCCFSNSLLNLSRRSCEISFAVNGVRCFLIFSISSTMSDNIILFNSVNSKLPPVCFIMVIFVSNKRFIDSVFVFGISLNIPVSFIIFQSNSLFAIELNSSIINNS